MATTFFCWSYIFPTSPVHHRAAADGSLWNRTPCRAITATDIHYDTYTVYSIRSSPPSSLSPFLCTLQYNISYINNNTTGTEFLVLPATLPVPMPILHCRRRRRCSQNCFMQYAVLHRLSIVKGNYL